MSLQLLFSLVVIYASFSYIDAYSLLNKRSFHSVSINKYSENGQMIIRRENRLYDSSSGSESDDPVSRRRKRARAKVATGRSEKTNQETPSQVVAETMSKNKNINTFATETKIPATAKPNEESVEQLFGLGNDQLRELLEQELPVPREDLVTKKEVVETSATKDKAFNLPELSEYLKETAQDVSLSDQMAEDQRKRVSRKDDDEYLRVLQLNPFADADDTLFLEETGHGMLLLISLLSGFVYAPGNPLTEFPIEIRDFIKGGLAVVYSINTVLAVQAYFRAKSKNLPGLFWAMKTLILGGVAFYEVTQAKDPLKLNEVTAPSKLKGRKSKK